MESSTLVDVGYGVGLYDNASAALHNCRIATTAETTPAGNDLLVGAVYVSATSHATSLNLSHTHVTGPLWLGEGRPRAYAKRALRGSFREYEDGGVRARAGGEGAQEQGDGEGGRAGEGWEEELRKEKEALEGIMHELVGVEEKVQEWFDTHGIKGGLEEAGGDERE
jgi:hypothetical protein